MVINPGDVWIIEEPTWPYSCDTTSLDNGNPLAVTTINMPTNNFVDETLVIAGFTVDVNGNESPDGDAPIREDWVFGAEGLSKVAGLVFQMRGTLGVESNAAQPLYLNRPVAVGDVKGMFKRPPLAPESRSRFTAAAPETVSPSAPHFRRQAGGIRNGPAAARSGPRR